MATIKTIAIVGATGQMGSSLARSLSKGPIRLLLVSAEVEKLEALTTDLAKSTSCEVYAIPCAREASWEADVIVLSAPYETEGALADKIREVSTGKIVISLSNHFDSNNSQLVTRTDTSAAEELQKKLPHSKVVKVFNTPFATGVISALIGGKTEGAYGARWKSPRHM